MASIHHAGPLIPAFAVAIDNPAVIA